MALGTISAIVGIAVGVAQLVQMGVDIKNSGNDMCNCLNSINNEVQILNNSNISNALNQFNVQIEQLTINLTNTIRQDTDDYERFLRDAAQYYEELDNQGQRDAQRLTGTLF